jgi:hypothetical protein
MPISYSPPARLPAHVSKRLSTSDNTNNVRSNTEVSDGITRARTYGYDNTIYIIKYILDECQSAKCSDDRTNIAIKAFDYLNKNPTILIYEPSFRIAVINKMNELNELMKKRVDGYNKAEYDKAINLMKMSMRVHITNSKMRNKIYTSLNAITNTLSDYKESMVNNKLSKTIKDLSDIIQSIKTHPNYVV